jgi:hypothetical protein
MGCRGREGNEREMLATLLDLVPAEAAGWAAVVAGLCMLAAWLACQDRRRSAQDAAASRQAHATPPSLSLGDSYEVKAARDVNRAAEIAAMQATAALQVDAVEHAYNRLLAQCAPFMGGLAPRLIEAAGEPGKAAAAGRALAA